MGSTVERSTMQKKSIAALKATGLQDSLASSICASVILESLTLWLISWANFLLVESWFISDSSLRISAMSPVSLKLLSISSSILSNCFWSCAFFFTISIFFYSRLGFSKATICASICSSSPEGVIAKFIIVTLTNVSGG